MTASEWKLNLDRNTFLAQHWQSKPLLIRNAINAFEPPVSSHELAGLALEYGVESRIVECRSSGWTVQHGPFQADDFTRDQPWTLLVQAVDHYFPNVAALHKLIDFIPQWRVDDIMISYAVEGGSVGPHYDNYDVFLLQGSGERLWRLGQFCDDTTALIPHNELRILDNFETSEEHVLRCGDMLYVPPGIAHWGVAQTECMTFSIGFRAPRITDMVSRWADQLLEKLEPDRFYRDSKRTPATRPGEIHQLDLERAMTEVQRALDQADGNHWFGELVTEPYYAPTQDEDEVSEARALLKNRPKSAELSSDAKLAWQQEAQNILVFVNGESRELDGSVLPTLLALCENRRLGASEIKVALACPASATLLEYLVDSGVMLVQ